MKDYEIQTIKEIRSIGNKLLGKSDEWIRDKYREWSKANYAAGWINYGAKEFYEWATTAPMDEES